MNGFDIFFWNLTAEAQAAFLQFMHLSDPEEGNYDVFPIITITTDERDEE